MKNLARFAFYFNIGLMIGNAYASKEVLCLINAASCGLAWWALKDL
jgi:hypothetical protein